MCACDVRVCARGCEACVRACHVRAAVGRRRPWPKHAMASPRKPRPWHDPDRIDGRGRTEDSSGGGGGESENGGMGGLQGEQGLRWRPREREETRDEGRGKKRGTTGGCGWVEGGGGGGAACCTPKHAMAS